MTDQSHAPLPYKVTLRRALTEDSVPDVIVEHVIAYSIFEAVSAAIIQAHVEGANFKIETVEPDIDNWLKYINLMITSKQHNG